MEYVAQNNFGYSPSSKLVQGYYSQVVALTPKETQPQTGVPLAPDSHLSWLYSPLLIYGSVILFFAIFLGALVVQIVSKSLDMKRTLTTLVVALVIATIPYSLRSVLDATRLELKASPDEVPRQVQIVQKSETSVLVRWETQTQKLGSVRIGPAPLNESTSHLVIGDSGKKTVKHSTQIENLEPGIQYELEILSGSKWYNDQGKPLNLYLTPD